MKRGQILKKQMKLAESQQILKTSSDPQALD